MKRVVLVTGASGFVGGHAVRHLAAEGWTVRAASRAPAADAGDHRVEAVRLPDLSRPVDWPALLDGVSHVVHLAGIAHSTAQIPKERYQAVNGEAVRTLGEAARDTDVKVVFVSSVRAQVGPVADSVVSETDRPAPIDAYGASKLQGERGLAEAGGRWVILRPVLVYGPGVKGNMAMLARLARSPVPLPLGGLQARRSLLGIDNLAGAISFALEAPAADGGTFLVADDEAPTVAELIANMRQALGRRPRLVSVPSSLLGAMLGTLGKREAWQRLSGSLVVDNAALKAMGWRPSASLTDGIANMMKDMSA